MTFYFLNLKTKNNFFFIFSFVYSRRDILEYLVQLQDFENLFLPTALRQFFSEVSAPDERGSYLTEMMEKFSDRYCRCNPNLGLSKGNLKSYHFES